MVQQIEIVLKPKRRGFHLVTSEILSQLPKLPKISTSASTAISVVPGSW